MTEAIFGRAELDKATLNPRAARGREQSNIDRLGGARSTGGTSSNKINSVSDKNPKKGLYEQARKQEFGE